MTTYRDILEKYDNSDSDSSFKVSDDEISVESV